MRLSNRAEHRASWRNHRSAPSRRSAALLTLLVGMACLIYGAWIPLKAEVAQVLLARSWWETHSSFAAGQQSEKLTGREASSGSAFKPWPWADTWPVARLRLPRQSESLIVLAGDTGQAMAFGPGLRHGEALEHRDAANLVIAGHRDTHFAGLERVVEGQTIELQLAGKPVQDYRVVHTAIVHHKESWPLADPLDGSRLLTLVTCYPFDAILPGGQLRWVVQAQRVAGDGPGG